MVDRILKERYKEGSDTTQEVRTMSDMINRLLRPFIRFFFNNIYYRVPFHQEILWFFCKHYFVEGYDPTTKNWKPLEERLSRFTGAGYHILLNYCTEDAATPAESEETKKIYCEMISSVAELQLANTVSVSMKMSQFGCFSHDAPLACFGLNTAESVVRFAWQKNIRVIFDGERLEHAPAVKIFAAELAKKYNNVAIRLQAYDPYFNEETTRFVETNLRKKIIIPLAVCKGAYNEPDALSERETRENILWAIRYCRAVDYPVELDTNDENLIRTSRAINVGMLYGITANAAQRLQKEGYCMHIYFPVVKKISGHEQNPQWEKFAIRRLIERPLYIFYPLKSLADWILHRKNYF